MLSHCTVFSVAERRRSPSATNVDKSAASRISHTPPDLVVDEGDCDMESSSLLDVASLRQA